jgi:hypothetical protein
MPEQRGIVPQAHRPLSRREQPRPNEGMRPLPLRQVKPPSLSGYPAATINPNLPPHKPVRSRPLPRKKGFERLWRDQDENNPTLA